MVVESGPPPVSTFAARHFEEIIELVAGLSLGAAGAPDFSVDVDQSRFVAGFVDRSAANAGGAINERQFMIFLEEDHHAVRELDPLRLLRLEDRELRDGNLLPALGLRGQKSWDEKRCEQAASGWACASLSTSLTGGIS